MSTSPVSSSDTIEWIDKFQAAQRLKLSVTRVLGIAGKGLIKTKPGRNKRGQPVNLLHAGDIERLAFERDNPPPVRPYHRTEESVQSAVPVKVSHVDIPMTREMLTGLGMLMADRIEAFHGVKSGLKPWLSLNEAAEFSGLPASAIKALILSGQLPVIDCGPRPGGRWRVKRVDLEKLEGHR